MILVNLSEPLRSAGSLDEVGILSVGRELVVVSAPWGVAVGVPGGWKPVWSLSLGPSHGCTARSPG